MRIMPRVCTSVLSLYTSVMLTELLAMSKQWCVKGIQLSLNSTDEGLVRDSGEPIYV